MPLRSSMPKIKEKEMGPLLFLSLFLLLLAFFILLNSLATFEQIKARAVLNSLVSTFHSEKIPQIKAEILISTLDDVPEPEEALDEIKRLWVTAVPLMEVESFSDGQYMQMRMAITDLFIEGDAVLRPDKEDVIQATASVLSSRFDGAKLTVDITIGVQSMGAAPSLAMVRQKVRDLQVERGDDPDYVDLEDPTQSLIPIGDLDESEVPLARMSLLGQALSDAGAPDDVITVGMRLGNPGYIRFRYTITELPALYQSFDGGQDQ